MSHDGPAPDEPVYNIGVAARMVDLHPQTLRHYEKLGLVQPARSSGGNRRYSQQDIARLRQINGLIEDLGVNLAGVEVILRMSRQIEELQQALAGVEERIQVEIERRRTMLEDRQGRLPRLPGGREERAG